MTEPDFPSEVERRTRGRRRHVDLLRPVYGALRLAWDVAHNVYAALGILILGGLVLAIGGTWAFGKVASEVREGETQVFDDAVLHWLGAHQDPLLARIGLEITTLGNASTIFMVVAISGMFLWLTRHRYSAALLFATTASEVVINALLKSVFDRPRPQIFNWGDQVISSSFPSGHAMSAAAVYFTVAYLAARLQRRRWARMLTLAAALVVVLAIGASRMYLGVHYPSDVVAGIVMGLAWAAFCMAVLEALQRLAVRRAPEVLADEVPPPRAVE